MGNPRFYEHGKVYFVTFRTEHGLPFVCIPLINEILWSCLARAQQLYPQIVIGLSFEANHWHLLIRCVDPELIPDFIGYMKQESAHAVNHLLGIRKHTVWAEGYDAPRLLDYKTFLNKFAYTLLNPFKDRLVPSIDLYQGVNSWKLFQDNVSQRAVKLIARSSVQPLNDPSKPWKESPAALKDLLEKNRKSGSVKFDFYSWKECFPETEDLSNAEVRALMLEALDVFEQDSRLEFAKLPVKKSYSDLSKQSMLKDYRPTKFGRKSICLSTDKDLTKDFLDVFFRKKGEAREVFELWKLGDLAVKFPPGMFAPNLPRTANIAAVPEQGFI